VKKEMSVCIGPTCRGCMQNITNHFSLLCDKLFSGRCTDSILGEKNKDENIASATIQEGKLQNTKHLTKD